MDPRRRSDRDSVRAFFAVALDEGVREAVAGLVAALRAREGGDAVRWVRPESLHVTLHFLGSIETEQVPTLIERVAAETAVHTPFRLRASEVSVFPSPRRPRAVVLELEPEAPLTALAAAVTRGVVAAGFPAEERPYRSHLTLGRIGGRGKKKSEIRLDVTASVTPVSDAWVVSEAVLYRSDLRRSGAKYTPLGRTPLTGGATGGSDHP